jgi:Ca2+-transporting ATPase
VADALARLESSERGLTTAEAAARLARYGPNELPQQRQKSPWHILWEQLSATMVVILLVAAAVSVAVGDEKDAIVILVIVVLNALLGFVQEYRAERAIAALQRLAVPTARVYRDGQVREVSARDLVPGDVVLLEAGNQVPADGRLLAVSNLRVQEAALTGESEPVGKEAAPLAVPDLPLGDRRNMAYMGTLVTYGRGILLVTATGPRTELGAVAAMIQGVSAEPTPLQRRLDQLGRGLAAVALALVAVIFVLGLLRGEDPRLMFLTAVSIAVAAVPEGLPAVVTIALALGAQRMLRRRALIRKLPAVETLGSVTVICSDKTGTLTENRMTVAVLDVAGRRVDLTEELQWHEPVLVPDQEPPPLLREAPALALLLTGSALCNDALLVPHETGRRTYHAVGDPMEAALVVAAARLGLWQADLQARFPRVAEVPFDSDRKRMTTVHRVDAAPPEPGWGAAFDPGSYIVFTKGAVDSLLALCTGVWVDGRSEPLTEAWRAWITASQDRLAEDGMRVLGVAFRPISGPPLPGQEVEVERDLIFVGLVGLYDPPRPEVKEAVATCKAAGIRPVMITGDHPLTALYIARRLGIATDGRALTGPELDRLGPEDFARQVADVAVYARVSPAHKLRLVEALQARGEIVAMTGDGVNDAPALKRADIGVAMGVTGTDVAKEAAHMVLLDDNFATIVAAVEEGRVLYDNIRRFIKYMATTNSGEIWVMLLAPFLGMPLPLLPLQILWMNLVSDGPPALALSVERAEPDTMRRPPYPPRESIFARGLGWHVVWVGALMAVLSLGVGYTYWAQGASHWQTMLFATLVFAQMAHVLAVRSERHSLFRIGLSSNPALFGAVVLTVVLQLAVIYVPGLQELFSTEPLAPRDLAIAFVVSSVVFWAVETEKWWRRRRAPAR